MNILYRLITGAILAVCLFVFESCEKNIEGYTQDARVYFFERATDLNKTRISSRTYTFITMPLNEYKDTLYIKVKTMGAMSNVDRYTIGKVINEGTTAIEGVDFEFIPGVVPKGQVEGTIAVVLNRTARLKNETVGLNLAIGDTNDFKGGVKEDSFFTLRWSDRLVKPDTWPFYFGTYSDVKYQFVIDVLGITDFPAQTSPRVETLPGQYSLADLQDMASILRTRLRELNEQNVGNPKYPLRDENDVLVIF